MLCNFEKSYMFFLQWDFPSILNIIPSLHTYNSGDKFDTCLLCKVFESFKAEFEHLFKSNFDLAPLCPLSLCKSHETKIKYQTGTISGTNLIRLYIGISKNCYT